MTIRLLRKQTSKHPSNALFPQEQNTRIAPTRIINETELDLTAGMVVTVNWDREKVEAEIRLVYGTFITKTTFTLLFSQDHLHRVIIVCHLHVSYAVLHIVEMVAWENVVVFFLNCRSHAQTLWFMFLSGEKKFALFLKLWISTQYQIRKWSSRSFL